MARVCLRVTDIRPMTVGDLGAVIELEKRTYVQSWSEGIFRDELAAVGRSYFVARGEDGVVGYAGLMVIGEDAHVTTVAVDRDAREGAIGTRLMLRLVDAALEWCARNLTLEVRASNTAAQALYRKFGMAPVGVRKNYYRDEDALIMWAHDIDGDEYRARLAEIREGLA